MAASTITRDTWTNDTGSAAVPNADGTVINNAALQNNIYARIDAMFAGAGAYATFTLGGLLAVEGFGSHTYSAGGVGGNQVTIRNTTAGAGNYAALWLGNDSSSVAFGIFGYSSTYTTTGPSVADGMQVYSGQAGGMSIAAQHASGPIRFYAGGTTERMRLTAGQLFIGDTSNADITVGLTINQGANDDAVLALKSSDVAHGIGTTETDTFGQFEKTDDVFGGLKIRSLTEAITGSDGFQMTSEAAAGSGDTTKGTGSSGYFGLRAYENNASPGANENLLVVCSGNVTRFILDSDGDSHQDVGTAWTNFDDYEDHELLSAFSAIASRKGDPLRHAFGSLLKKHRSTLVKNKIVTVNEGKGEDGSVFVNWSRLKMLMVGAIRQNAVRIKQQDGQIAALKQRLRALET